MSTVFFGVRHYSWKSEWERARDRKEYASLFADNSAAADWFFCEPINLYVHNG